MLKQDDEIASFGAEALPGGLAEINDTILSQPHAADRVSPSPAKAPLVGLLALAAHWMRKHGDRRKSQRRRAPTP